MTALLAILSAIIGNKTIMAIFAAVVGGLGLYVAGGISRAKKDAAAHAAEETKARDISDQVDNDIGALPGGKAREELKTWQKP